MILAITTYHAWSSPHAAARNMRLEAAACAGVAHIAVRVHTVSLVMIELERALYPPLDPCFCWGFWLVEFTFARDGGNGMV
jgi:hypothetical protein